MPEIFDHFLEILVQVNKAVLVLAYELRVARLFLVFLLLDTAQRNKEDLPAKPIAMASPGKYTLLCIM